MELNELKEAWTALDNRLKRNEALKESIILEMMKSKAGKLVNRFMIWEIISVVVLTLMIPLIIFQLDRFGGKNWAIGTTLLFILVGCFVYPFWGVFKIHGLMKFDISKHVSNNIYCVNRYRIQLNREKKVFYYFVGPVLVILGVSSYATAKATLPLWAFLFCMFIVGGLVCYWSYKWSNKSIDSIIRSLDEIKELKEE